MKTATRTREKAAPGRALGRVAAAAKAAGQTARRALALVKKTTTAAAKRTRAPWESMTDVIRAKHPKASDVEIRHFYYTARRLGLDPMTNQIHLISRWDSNANDGQGANVATIQVGIDGFRAKALESGRYAGGDDVVFNDGMTEYAVRKSGDQVPTTATKRIRMTVGGSALDVTATAGWASYYPNNRKLQFMWDQFPFLMLGKCAEALALRQAFPALLSGVYAPEETHRFEPRKESDRMIAAKPARALPKPEAVVKQIEDQNRKEEKALPEDKRRALAALHAEAHRLGLFADNLRLYIRQTEKVGSTKDLSAQRIDSWTAQLRPVKVATPEHEKIVKALDRAAQKAAEAVPAAGAR